MPVWPTQRSPSQLPQRQHGLRLHDLENDGPDAGGQIHFLSQSHLSHESLSFGNRGAPVSETRNPWRRIEWRRCLEFRGSCNGRWVGRSETGVSCRWELEISG